MTEEKSSSSTSINTGGQEPGLSAQACEDAQPGQPDLISEEHMRDPIARFTSRGYTLAETASARTRYPRWWRAHTFLTPETTLWRGFRFIPYGEYSVIDFGRHWDDGCTFLEPGGRCRVPMCQRVEGPEPSEAELGRMEEENEASVAGMPGRVVMAAVHTACTAAKVVNWVLGEPE